MGSDELTRLILATGSPCKDEDWDGEWRDYDWDHEGNGCSGWQETDLSEVVEVAFQGGTVTMVTHCRCACRLHPHVTVGLQE